MNLDKTITLESLISDLPDQNPLQLLGELQFAFVTFVLGENFDSFEQWKSLMMLLCGCREAMATTRRDLYYRLVPVLYVQIEQLPEEFFVENNEGESNQLSSKANNFIYRAMNDLIEASLEPEVSPMIRKRMQKLQQLIVDKFGFKPVQTEEQRVLQKFLKTQQQQASSNSDS